MCCTIDHMHPFVYGFWKTRNDGIFRITFRRTFFKNFRNGSKWSKYTYVWVRAYLEQYVPITRFFGKHGILDGILRNFFESLKTDSKRFQMVQTYPSMSLRTFVNAIRLILHNLENTKFFDGIPYNMLINSINTFYSTVRVPKCSSIILCQFEEHRSDALP